MCLKSQDSNYSTISLELFPVQIQMYVEKKTFRIGNGLISVCEEKRDENKNVNET